MVKDENLFKFVKKNLAKSMKMHDDFIRAKPKQPRGGDFPPRPPEQPQPDARVDRNAADAVDRWRDHLREQGLSAEQADEIINGFQADMADATRAMADSGARASPEMARDGATPGGLQTAHIQEAASLAVEEVGDQVLERSLVVAGVPQIKIPDTLHQLSNIVKGDKGKKPEKPKKPKKKNRRRIFRESAQVIAENADLEGVAVQKAAAALFYGNTGPSIESMLRSAGVPEANVEQTLSDVYDAIKQAGPGARGFEVAVDVINEAAVLPATEAGLLTRDGIDAGIDAGVVAIGASYMLWQGMTTTLWDSVAKMKDGEHSKIREEILALGPPPEMTAWRNFAFPYQRGRPGGPGNRNGTTSAFPTTTPFMNSTVLPTSTALPTSTVTTTKTSAPTPTSTYPPGRQPCTAPPSALKERYASQNKMWDGMTPKFRKEVDSHQGNEGIHFYLSEVAYQLRALDDDAFKPRSFEPWYTAELRADPDYRARTLEIVTDWRDTLKARDDYNNKRDNYAHLLRTFPTIRDMTANKLRTQVCEWQAAVDGKQYLPGYKRWKMRFILGSRKRLWTWVLEI